MATRNGFVGTENTPLLTERGRRSRTMTGKIALSALLALNVAVAARGETKPAPNAAQKLAAPAPASSVQKEAASKPAADAPPASDPRTPSDTAKKPAKARRNTIPTSPLEIAEALGVPFMAAFIITSVIVVWFTIERLLVLRRGRVIPRPFVERFLQNLEQGNLDQQQALQLCEENGSPIATIFAHGIRKWGKPGVEVEQAIIDGGERQVSQLRNHLRSLNAAATIAPLLGLLGTVIGMIQCFNEIAGSQAMGKADQLAGGIAIALLCTAVGLFIAITSLTMYMFLTGRADSLVMDMDLLAQNVVHLVSAEALAEESQPVSKERGRRTTNPMPEPKERKAV